MFVCCECCVLSGRGLCDKLITRPEESYRLWCVVTRDLETWRMRRPWAALGSSTTGGGKKKIVILYNTMGMSHLKVKHIPYVKDCRNVLWIHSHQTNVEYISDQFKFLHKVQKRGTANKTFTSRTQHVTTHMKYVKSCRNFHYLSQGQ